MSSPEEAEPTTIPEEFSHDRPRTIPNQALTKDSNIIPRPRSQKEFTASKDISRARFGYENPFQRKTEKTPPSQTIRFDDNTTTNPFHADGARSETHAVRTSGADGMGTSMLEDHKSWERLGQS